MHGGRHSGRFLVVFVALASTAVAMLTATAGRDRPAPAPTEVAVGALTGAPATLDATRDVPLRAPVAFFTDPDRGAARDAMGFVETSFRDLLGRGPGPANLAQWTERLELGGPRTALTTMLTTSSDYRERTVARLYLQYLRREASADAVSHWASLLRQGVPTGELRAYLLASSEYFTRAGGTTDGFVATIYADVLGRPPDRQSADHWTSRLGSGAVNQEDVARSLLASGEARRLFVSSVYEELLGRPAATGEAHHWATLLDRGLPEEDVIAAVVASAEYFDRLPSDYTAHVDWGDRATGAAAVRRVGADTLEVTAAHAFASPGTFTVQVTLIKGDGTRATATSSVRVEAPSNERFVDSLFRALLGRAAGQETISNWARTLAAGGGDAREVAVRRMLATSERRRLVVRELFERYLDRTPTAEAASGWVAALDARSVDWLRARLLGSNEYLRTQAGGSVTGFVDAVFRDVLARPPDAANRSRLTSQITGGTSRVEVAESLLATSEARRRLVNAHYTALLDRPPRDDESRHWVQSLGRGTTEHQLIASLLGSSEYFARFPPVGAGWETETSP